MSMSNVMKSCVNILFRLAGIASCLFVVTGSAQAGNALHNNDVLTSATCLHSSNSKYFLCPQSDGNLVLYKGSGPTDSHGVSWASNTQTDFKRGCFLIVQDDGNLVLYNGTGPSDQHGVIWASNTRVAPGTRVNSILEDNGRFAIYREESGGKQVLLFSVNSPPRDSITICKGQSVPDRYVIVGQTHSDGCNWYGVRDNAIVIENIQSDPSGTQIAICKGQDIPSGWVTISNSHSDACNWYGVRDNAIVIKKL
jgi:hypothetical protein